MPDFDGLQQQLEIGDVRFRRTGHMGEESVHGYTIEHRRPDAPEMRCTVGLQLCHRVVCGAGSHDLIQADPLTIAPSLGCPVCGWHVYIREGKIIDAGAMSPGTELADARDFPMWD